jgi:hypothetical protein
MGTAPEAKLRFHKDLPIISPLLMNNLTFATLILLTDGKRISAALNIMSVKLDEIQCLAWQPQGPFDTTQVQGNGRPAIYVTHSSENQGQSSQLFSR